MTASGPEQERRRYPRLERVGEVEVSGKEGLRCTKIVNIGLGGIRLNLTAAVEPGTKVRLRLRLTDEEQPIDISGQVVWARRSSPFEVGVRFVEVDLSRLERVLV